MRKHLRSYVLPFDREDLNTQQIHMSSYRSTPLGLSIFTFAALLNFSATSHAAITCDTSFTKVQAASIPASSNQTRNSASGYIRIVQEKQNKVVQPKFANPSEEARAEKTWKGTFGPKLINDLLVPGTSLITHGLKGANEAGLVKTGSGNMVHLRADLDGFTTNIGVNFLALKENAHRQIKSYVRDDAQAVIIFIHGGGTNTTGHHVAAQIMDFMNPRGVDVISLDLKWHGEGSRTSPESIRQELEEIRRLTKTLTANTNKPIFLVGHSMGGVISDLYMRYFPSDTLFQGVVPLSTVADVAPGKTLKEKHARELELEAINSKNPEIPADERNLGQELARSGKISPTCGFYCDVLMTGVDWSKSQTEGPNYLPALYIIGNGDSLYQGNQKAFAEGVAALPNAELVVYGPRRDIKARDDEKVVIGHLIFDHKPLVEFASDVSQEIKNKYHDGKLSEKEFNSLRSEGKIKLEAEFQYDDIKSPETFVRIRNFISKQIGRELPRLEPSRDAFDDIALEYMKNLAFREFARGHQYLHYHATQEGAAIGQELGLVTKAIGPLQSLQKKGEITEAQSSELAALRKKNASLLEILTNKGVVAEANKAQYADYQQRINNLRADLAESKLGQRPESTNQLKHEIEQLRQNLSRLKKEIDEARSIVHSERLDQAHNEINTAFENLMAKDSLVRELSNQYLLANTISPGVFQPKLYENMPKEIKDAYAEYEVLSESYQERLVNYETILIDELATGNFTIETQTQNGQTNGPKNIGGIEKSARELKQVNEDIRKLHAEFELRSINRAKISAEILELQIQAAKLVEAKYFVPKVYTIAELLENITIERKELSSILQKIWADWNTVWSERPIGAEAGEGLY